MLSDWRVCCGCTQLTLLLDRSLNFKPSIKQSSEFVSGDNSFLITARGLGFEVGMETHFLLCEVKDDMTWCTPVSSVHHVKP